MARTISRSIQVSASIYRFLLRVYPTAHRQEFGPWMGQLFRDLCRDAYAQQGLSGLLRLWVRTLPDLVVSASAAHCEAAGEVLMNLSRTVAPLSWWKVALVVIPGILFGISRAFYPLGWAAILGFLLVAALALGSLLAQRRLPAWGMLALGLVTAWALQWILLEAPRQLTRSLVGIGLPAARGLGVRLLSSPDLQQWLIAVPTWLVLLWLLWRYRPLWRPAAWAVLLLGLMAAAAWVTLDPGRIAYAGLVLLPVVLGLPLARQSGSLAALFLLGAFIYQVLFDSDYYSAYLLKAQLYPLYVILLIGMVVGVAPLLLLRARTQAARAAGLLAPVLVWSITRVVVPWLLSPQAPAARLRWGDALLSIFVPLILALAFYIYAKVNHTETPPLERETGQVMTPG